MGPIKILTQDLINQIAAGEVIERPASVVKELLENSVDAGAGSISIEMQGNGLDLIRVSDDGSGMGESDLELAIQRHATSKISTTDDLFAINTLGFRGEALPSILSVSRSSISSRQPSSPYGHSLDMEAGNIKRRTKKGMPPGTIIEITDLFYNTPARRKFLKTAATEQRNVIDVVSRYALAYPCIRLSLEINRRLAITLPAQSNLKERATAVLGASKAESLLPFRREFPGIKVHGLLALPNETRQNRSGIHAFVNNRSVKDVLLGSAVMEGYRGLLMKGRYPLAVLFVDLDPAEVDVNVHPAKAEVRFRHASAVFAAVAKTLKEVLVPGERTQEQHPASNTYPEYDCLKKISERHEVNEERSMVFGPKAIARMRSESLFEDSSHGHAARTLIYSSLAVIGMLHSTYILLSDDSALYILDQHAAHERITFERLLALHGSYQTSTQLLMNPIILELSPQEFNAYEESAGQIKTIGIECEHFGRNTIAIRSVPQSLRDSDIKASVYGLIHAIMEGELHGAGSGSERLRSMLATIACHASVRAGRALSLPETESLLKNLDEAGSPLTCPHGRPLFRKISAEEIERWLGRKT